MAKKEKVGMSKMAALRQVFTKSDPKKYSIRFDESDPGSKINPLQNIYVSKAALEAAGISGTPSKVTVLLQVEE